MPEDKEKAKEDRLMSFWDHTEELAKRLRIVLYTLFISTAVMMVLPADLSFLKNPTAFYDPLVAVILRSIREQVLPPDVKLIGLEFTAPIQLYLIASFIFGLAVTVPVFAYEIYRFIDPALYPHERRDVYPFVASVSVLFVVGAFFGYRVLMPYLILAMFPFFTAVGAEMVISIMDFYTILFVTTIITGLAFTFPVYFVLLVKYGIVSTGIFTKNRRYIYAAFFIITMILTPDGGFPLGNLMIWIPMVLLMEIGILFARRYERKGGVRRVSWLSRGASCKFCGASISADAAFCPQCGKSQK
jgi:sec-independent protein translocase protein TatC